MSSGTVWDSASTRSLAELSGASLARARRRLGRVAVLLGLALNFMAFAGLGWIAWLGVDRDLTTYTQDVDIISANLWLLVALLAWTRLDDLRVLRAGQLAVVLSSFTMAFVTGLNAVARETSVPVLTWSTVWIAIYPLLVPSPPRITIRVVAAAVLLTPLGTALGGLAWGPGADLPSIVATVVAPAVAAVIAVVGSEIVHGTTVDIEALREHERLLETVLHGVEEAISLRGPDGVEVFASDTRAPAAVLAVEGLSVHVDEAAETWLVTRKTVPLGGRDHDLVVARRMSRALDQAEIKSWKQLIRVLSHELNNSLAPMSSLLHSVELMVGRPEHVERLRTAVTSLQQRTEHLGEFLGQYAAFARLPQPRPVPVEWRDFVGALQPLAPFTAVEPIEGRASFDRAQIEQGVLNLLNNAAEAGGPPEAVTLSVRPEGEGWLVTVADRGSGLSDEVAERAVVPFFSTKERGTGLGLALCREIALAHGGWLALVRREGGGAEARLFLPGDPP